MGIYETVPVEDENGDTYALWQFTYNGEKRLVMAKLLRVC